MTFTENNARPLHCVQAFLRFCAMCVLGDCGGKLGCIAKTQLVVFQ